MQGTWNSLLVLVATLIALIVSLIASLTGVGCSPGDGTICDPVHLPPC